MDNPIPRKDKCRTCEKMAAMGEEEFNRITDQYLSREEHRVNLVSREETIRRLEICHSCDSLSGGVTCEHCACLVPVMVRLKSKSCPRPGGGRW